MLYLVYYNFKSNHIFFGTIKTHITFPYSSGFKLTCRKGLWFIFKVIELTKGMRKEEGVKNVAYNF